MLIDTIILNQERNVTLTAYIQDVGGEFDYITKRPAMLILPGGAYMNCSDREADPVAMAYLKAGYQTFILRYSVGPYSVWPTPLNDYEQAMAQIRARAEEWHLYPDKVAVVGFSAGGHLASAAAAMSVNRPNAAILGYAATGSAVKECNPSAPCTIDAVDELTCPCFLFATRNDSVVPISNTLEFINSLEKYDISFECHIYAYGPHGFSTADASVQSTEVKMCSRVPDWVQDSIAWLGDVLGEFGPEGLKEPVCKSHATANGEPYLSLDCTIGYLRKHAKAKPLIEPLIDTLVIPGTGTPGHEMQITSIISHFKNEPLGQLLNQLKLDKERIAELDRQLSAIRNK